MQAPCLTAEHELFRVKVREQLHHTVLPHAERWEAQGHITRDGWQALGEQGLLGLPHSGEGFLRSAVFLDELGYLGYAGIRAAIGVHAYMAPAYIALFGSPEQQRTYLGDTRNGNRIAALAITEANAGSDLHHLQTYADPGEADGYRVTGQKCYVANGSQADFFVTLVKTGRPGGPSRGITGTSLLIIDGDAPGLERSPLPMLGWRSADVCQIDLDGVWVPADRLLGRRNKAFLHLMQGLDFERLVAGLLAMGGARHCLDLVGQFARDHQVNDAPLDRKQVVRHRLADLMSELDVVRHYAYNAAWSHGLQGIDTQTASILKLRASELALAAAQSAIRYHGARGYREDSASARIYRDAVAGTVTAGANEVLRDLIFETASPSGFG